MSSARGTRPLLALGWVLLCATTSALSNSALAQGRELPTSPTEVPVPPLRPFVAPRPVRLKLEKGARLLVIESDALPLVDGTLLFRGGLRQVALESAGLAELWADVLREGGSDRTSGAELDRWLDSHAASIAVTAEDDALRIDFSCVSSDLDNVMEFIGELLMIPAFPAQELEKSRTRLLTKIARRDEDSAQFARYWLDRLCYGEDSRSARRPSLASVQPITRADLQEFHDSSLATNRMIVGATGAVSPAGLAARLDGILSKLPVLGNLERERPEVFRRPSRTRIHLYDRPGMAQAEIRLACPGTRRVHQDYVPLYLWSYVVGAGGLSNRMMVRLRTELGLIYQGGMFFAPEWNRAGRLIGRCRTSSESVGEVVRQLVQILKSATAPIPESELEAVRRRLQNSLVFEVDRPEEVLERALDAELYGTPVDFWERRDANLSAVDQDDVAAAVARYLDVDRLVILVVGPAEIVRPQLEALGEVVMIAGE